MASKYITEEEVVQILETYEETGRENGKPSILKTAKVLHCSEARVKRCLISEGRWSSKSSREAGEYWRRGLSVSEIAQKMHTSEQAIYALLPYSYGAYGEDTEANQRARKSKQNLKRADEEITEGVIREEKMENQNQAATFKPPTDMEEIFKLIFDWRKMTFLLDETVEKGVVSKEIIEEIEAMGDKVGEYHKNAELVYIDCAPESMGFHSPHLTFREHLFKARTQEEVDEQNKKDGKKRRLSVKLGYRQFLEKFLYAVTEHGWSNASTGSLYTIQQKILTALVDRNRYVVPVFINAQFLCDKTGGKYSVYNGAGDMIDTIRWLWDACRQPIILVGTKELEEAVARGVKNGDSNSQKVNWRVTVMRWNGK